MVSQDEAQRLANAVPKGMLYGVEGSVQRGLI